MTLTDLIMIAAILTGPLAAVLISVWLQGRQADKTLKANVRLNIFATILQNRHQILTHENVKALHCIDLVFADDVEVRRLWKEFVKAVRTEGLNDEDRVKSYNELLLGISHALGFSGKIDYLDVSRVLYPSVDIANQQITNRFMEEVTAAVTRLVEADPSRRETLEGAAEPK